MFFKEDMLNALDDAKEVFPICIPSYKRWDRKENKSITEIIEKCDKEIQDNTYIFVRKEQEEKYKESFRTVNIVVLPEVNGLAGTRQYICDYVTDVLKKDYFLDMDDDITAIKCVYFDKEDSKNKLSKKDEVECSKIIRLGCAIAKYSFEKYNTLLGNFRRVRFANNMENSQCCLIVNKGASPRQFMFINAGKLKKHGIKRNIEAFDPTGDDMGFIAEIAKFRGSFFNIPCLAYSFVDDSVNSVIRNDENRKNLASYEYEQLKKYPIKNYLRIPFTYEDGSYKFSDIDFGKYCKHSGVKSKVISLKEFVNNG